MPTLKTSQPLDLKAFPIEPVPENNSSRIGIFNYQLFFVQNFHASGGEISDLLAVENNVDHRGVPKILEIQSELRARSSVDPRVRRLPRSLLQSLSNNELVVQVLVRKEAVHVVAKMGLRRLAETVEALLVRIAVE